MREGPVPNGIPGLPCAPNRVSLHAGTKTRACGEHLSVWRGRIERPPTFDSFPGIGLSELTGATEPPCIPEQPRYQN
jgi:hypothetical protein